MSEKFDIDEIIKKLKEKRKIFTSEADLQLELAWIIKNKYKDDKNVAVRLEYCPDIEPQMHIDILVIIDEKWIPIELKYKTKEFSYTDSDGCTYNLKEQSAHDCGCYDYIKDIQRIETIREKKDKFEKGYTIFITNDGLYKKGPRERSSYKNFSLGKNREKITAGDILNWPKTKVVNKERAESITLKSEYKFEWKPFSNIDENSDECKNVNQFYILINEIIK